MKTLKEFVPLPTDRLIQDDIGLKEALLYFLGKGKGDRILSILSNWEKRIPGWNDMADEAARPEKLPRIERYDRVGNRIEKIVLPMETRTLKREVAEMGFFETGSEVEKFSIDYLLAQMGESGLTCPIACTDGLIRVISTLGSDFLKKEYLPKLKSVETPIAGAQFITEQAGGSDVGAIEGVAKPNEDGTWSITAEKWYCSAVDEYFLLLARPEGAPEGTKGLSIFFTPRLIDGKPNNLSIKQLKDKLGTQSLPTAEIDFEGSRSWLIGKKEDGFHNLMNFILNISRIHNAANSLGIHRRAFAEARHYADQRAAFGKEIISYPLIQESLIDILSHLSAKRSLYFSMLKIIDDGELLPKDREQRLWQRFLINLLKYRTAVSVTEHVKEAIIVYGANGIVQDFCMLPRLLRDSLIVETWEGAHNVLCLQILRDAGRFDFVGRLKKELGKIVKSWPEGVLPKSCRLYLDSIRKGEELLTSGNLQNLTWVQTHARRIVDHLGNLLEIGNLVSQGFARKNNNTLIQASYLAHSMLGGNLSGFKNPVVENLSSIGYDLVFEKPLKVDLKIF